MLEPRIETKPSMTLVGAHGTFISGLSDHTDAAEKIGPLWGSFIQRRGEIPTSDPAVCYGCSFYGDPEKRAQPDELEYVAGLEVPAGAAAPEGLSSIETPEGLYAVFEIRGPMSAFHPQLLAIYREWLPTSGYVGSGMADVERYDERWKPDGEDSVFEYWLGIAPKP